MKQDTDIELDPKTVKRLLGLLCETCGKKSCDCVSKQLEVMILKNDYRKRKRNR